MAKRHLPVADSTTYCDYDAQEYMTRQQFTQRLASFLRISQEDAVWFDGSPRAPKTPWGPAQGVYNIVPGVRWFHTAGHGGLMVSRPRADKSLTPAARKMGLFWGGAFWYEEDNAWAVVAFENPEWQAILVRKAGGKVYSQDELRHFIDPQYFRHLESGVSLPKVRPGDTLQLNRDYDFGSRILSEGSQVLVLSSTGAFFVVSEVGQRGFKYKLPVKGYIDGEMTKV